jgi:glycine cleavage system H lipoate-binding protein
MKSVLGNIWTDDKNGKVSVGFTKEYIDESLAECFHILPADTRSIKKENPLLVVETNNGLESICSPVSGKILFFSDKAKNFPDKLTDEDVIVEIELEGTKTKEVSASKPTVHVLDQRPALRAQYINHEAFIQALDWRFENIDDDEE